MKTQILRVLLLLPALAGSPAVSAGATETLQRFFDGMQTLEAQFTQTQSDEQGKLMQTSSGKVWLQRGSGEGSGLFRWNYDKPYAQEIVCDGQRIWLYDPDLAQVTVRPAAEALKGTPAALLSQRAALKDAFTSEEGGGEGGLQMIVLKPKAADTEFRRIELWLNGDRPARMRFEDPLGGSTEIRFSDVAANRKLKSTLFEFKPPRGVEIVDAGAAPTK